MQAACLTQTTEGEGRLRGRREKRGGKEKERESKGVKDRNKRQAATVDFQMLGKHFYPSTALMLM